MSSQTIEVFDSAFNDLPSNAHRLELINRLQLSIEQSCPDQIELPLTHHFAPSIYGREILLPADSLVVGKTHRHAHLNIISKGKVTVATEHGLETLEAPCSFTSPIGVKRVVYAHEDTIWTCIHPNPTDTTDLTELEGLVIVPDDRVAAFRLESGLEPITSIEQGE